MNDPGVGSAAGARRKAASAGAAGLLLALALAAIVTVHVPAHGRRGRAVLAASPVSAVRQPQTFTVLVKSGEEQGNMAPDGEWYDAFQTTDFVLRVGVPVTITIYNYDDMPHSFTSPALGVDHMVPGGEEDNPSITTFTFTPTRAGTFRWYCATPCDEWAMTHAGFMLGKITVVR